jgi:zinc D-Ala-D-Ala carboxypeptidase
MNWDKFPNFKPSEFACKHCDEVRMDETFMIRLQELRSFYGKPIRISSGYRCPEHNQSVSTTGPNGPHTTGKAVDIAVQGEDALTLLQCAFVLGWSRIGINQKGTGRFIHLDRLPGKAIWTY